MKKRLLSGFLCLCMLLTMVPAALAVDDQDSPDTQTTQTEENTQGTSESLPAVDKDGIIKLTQNVTLSNGYTVNSNETVTIDLNGYTLTANVICKGTLTVKDSTASNPAVERINDADNITYSGGKITSSNRNTLYVTEGGQATVESGMIEATGKNIAAAAEGTIMPNGGPVASSLTINGGFIEAKEFAASAQGKGAILTVNGGVLHAKDNAVVAGNGTNNGKEYRGGTTININGGTMIGNITSEGFVACGVYHPQAGTLNITGGTIITSGGVGVLMRGGQLNMTGGNIEVSGTATTGKVGDGTQSVGCYGVQVDGMSNYYDYTNCKVMISGGSVTATGEDMSAVAHTVAGPGSNVAQKVFISGGSFSSTVDNYLATGYTCTKDDPSGQYVVSVANGAQVDATTDEEGNVSATVDGNYSGNEESEGGEDSGISTDAGKVTIDVASNDGTTTNATKAEITVGSNALTSINKDKKVKEVELKTNVGTLTISDAAWNDMTAKATEIDKTASVVIKLKDKSTTSGNPVYEVTATVGSGENAENAFDGTGAGSVTISVPYTVNKEKGNVKVYCTDNEKMEDMNATLSDGILSWTTSHFSTFEVVAYDEDAEVTYQAGDAPASSGSFREALTAVASTGGTITQLKDVTVTNFSTTISENVTIQGEEGLKINLTTGSTNRNKAFTVSKDAKLTLDGVTMTISGSGEEGEGIGDGFDVQYGGTLELNNSNVTLSNLQAATISAKPQNSGAAGTGIFTLNHSTITATGIGGNFSNGGVWTLDSESAIEIDGCGAHGFSADRIEVKGNSSIDVEDTAYRGISINSTGLENGTDSGLIIEAGSAVSVTNCGDERHPAVLMTNESAANLIVNDGALLNVSATKEGKSSTISLSTNSSSEDTLKGAVIGSVTKGEASPTTYYAITFNVTPPDANIVVKDSDGKEVSAVNGKYALEKDKAYTYEVSKSGYRTQTGTFTVTEAETISVTLSSSGGGGGSVTTQYTLSFDTNGGSAIAKVTKEKGTTVDLGQYVPTREGYTFAGWYSDEALTQKVTSVKLNANTTVYAKWTENAVTPTLPFTDVKSGDWFYEAVQYVYDKGMMTGVSADRFAPASTTTRGMIVTILYRLENEPAVSGGSAFTDVENGAWYADAVAWAAANDIVNGTSATTFAPNSPITREQMATMLYRFAQYKGMDAVTLQEHLTGYPDGDQVSDYAIPAMNWAVGQGLIAGMENGTLVPQGSATRAQVATILMRFCENVMQ